METLRALHTIPPFDQSSADYYPVLYEIPHLPVYVVVAYLLLVYFGPKVMKSRQEWKLKTFTKYWNLVLSLLSFIIFINVIPYLLHLLFTKGLFNMVCIDRDEEIWFGFQQFCSWVFTITKIFELIDTLILILKKREVIFLHWYHHTTVLLYTWYCTYANVAIGWSFMTVNAFVHAFMYYYYFLRACNINPTWGKMITQMQVLQMVVGIFIAGSWSYYYLVGQCPEPYFNDTPVGLIFIASSVGMYASFLYLFAHYYIGRWSSSNPRSKTALSNTSRKPSSTSAAPTRAKKE